MYPEPLTQGKTVGATSAVVLVGISGPRAIDYLQFIHSSFPAINLKIAPKTNEIIAVEVPVGLKNLKLSTITFADTPGYYIGAMPMGYVLVEGIAVDIDRRGIYSLGTIDTLKPRIPRADLDRSQLVDLQVRLGGSLSELQPMNFSWPR